MYSECAHTSGTSRPRRLTPKEFQIGNVGCVPDLFREQAAVTGGGVLHYGQQSLRFVAMSGRKRVVGAFAGQQRPGTANPGAIERGSVFVLAIAVAVVAIPARTLRQFHCKQGVDGRKRVKDARIVRRAQTEAHQSQSVRTDDVIGLISILAPAVDS